MPTEADALNFQQKGKWSAIPRIARTIPFGYKIAEDNKYLLLPIEDELVALEKAKKYLRQYSYREVAQWLTEVTGRYISHMGLKKRVANERRRVNKKTSLEYWSKKLEETRTAIEALEKYRLGAREDFE
jgi:hypothetical protein